MPKEIKNTPEVDDAFTKACAFAEEMCHEFITPEHFLLALLRQQKFRKAIDGFGTPSDSISRQVESYLDEIETVPPGMEYRPEPSIQFRHMAEIA
ncbi:MAG: ATP-dependent Clp protease ATP-binding subunit ClpA, partial [Muribaculaceae bacterium]|nr:ATP-dependent Clp protease ATP-binding subunit ClpA [Muribaculaceae bacterium]